MSVVDHHDAAELVGEIAESRQRAQVAVHAEHSVGAQKRSLTAGQSLDETARRLDVPVGEHLDRCTAQARPVNDAGVIQLV
jgi:hypothetical protein